MVLPFSLINTSSAELGDSQSNASFWFCSRTLAALNSPVQRLFMAASFVLQHKRTRLYMETLWITHWSIKTIQHGDNVGKFRVRVVQVSSIALVVRKGSGCRSSATTARLTKWGWRWRDVRPALQIFSLMGNEWKWKVDGLNLEPVLGNVNIRALRKVLNPQTTWVWTMFGSGFY